MDYYSAYVNGRKPVNYKRISLLLVIALIVYINHNLIIFPNFSSEISFDGFILSAFVVLLGAILLTDTFKTMVLDNPEAIILSRDNVDIAALTTEVKAQQTELQQLLAVLKGQVEPEIITQFINNFYWLDVNKTGIQQVKAYLKIKDNNDKLVLLNQARRHNQLTVKTINQQLIVTQKVLYKKATPVAYNFSHINKDECFVIRQTFKIKRSEQGEIIKFAERITVKKKKMFSIALSSKS